MCLPSFCPTAVQAACSDGVQMDLPTHPDFIVVSIVCSSGEKQIVFGVVTVTQKIYENIWLDLVVRENW